MRQNDVGEIGIVVDLEGFIDRLVEDVIRTRGGDGMSSDTTSRVVNVETVFELLDLGRWRRVWVLGTASLFFP
jgi:hypothetical protein